MCGAREVGVGSLAAGVAYNDITIIIYGREYTFRVVRVVSGNNGLRLLRSAALAVW